MYEVYSVVCTSYNIIVSVLGYKAKLPERGLLYLLHWLTLSRDFKDGENLVEAGPWLEKVGT